MLTTEQITATLEQAITRYEELNKALANVDDQIRERDALRNQIDWLQSFPGLGEKIQADWDDATAKMAARHNPTEVVERATEITGDDVAAAHAVARVPDPQAAPIEVPETTDELRKLKVPELKAIAKQEGIELSARNKSDIVDELIDGLFDTSADEEPDYGTPGEADFNKDAYEASVPEGFTAAPEPAPAPQAAPEAAPAPQAAKSPFTF